MWIHEAFPYLAGLLAGAGITILVYRALAILDAEDSE